MELQSQKCVMVIGEGLPLGVIANTAAILGVTLGKTAPELVGRDVTDASGRPHLGIVAVPIPILRGTVEHIRAIRARLFTPEFEGVTVVDFSDAAQSCNIYPEFVEKMAQTAEEDLRYLGVALCGEKSKVNKLTGSMPLLR